MTAQVYQLKFKKPPEDQAEAKPVEITSEAKDEAIRALTKSTRYYHQRTNQLSQETRRPPDALRATTAAMKDLAESTHLIQIMLNNERKTKSKTNETLFQKISAALKSIL